MSLTGWRLSSASAPRRPMTLSYIYYIRSLRLTAQFNTTGAHHAGSYREAQNVSDLY